MAKATNKFSCDHGDANVAKLDLGQKFLCTNCGAKFYDLKKEPPTCPACETVHVPEEPPKPRRASAAAKKAPAKPAVAEAAKDDESGEAGEAGDAKEEDLVASDADADAEVDDDDDDVIEDTSDLGEEDDDVAGVVPEAEKDS